ncbi:MAG TPA: DUF2946 family protein [Dyella sp.]|nr:DUF2946 family protein [Dyella sp.]
MPIALRQRSFVAWLAVVALWLTITAPVVSRTLASPLDARVGIGTCGIRHPDGTRTPPAGHPLEKCGYCGLLAGHSMPPDAAPVRVAPPALTDPSPELAGPPGCGAVVMLAAAPRGPPGNTHA